MRNCDTASLVRAGSGEVQLAQWKDEGVEEEGQERTGRAVDHQDVGEEDVLICLLALSLPRWL